MFNLHGIESKPGGVVVTGIAEVGYEFSVHAVFASKEKRTAWTPGLKDTVLAIRVPYGNVALVPLELTLEIREVGSTEVLRIEQLPLVGSRDYLELAIAPEYVSTVRQTLSNDNTKLLRDAIKAKADAIQLANAQKLQADYDKRVAELATAIINDTV